MSGGVVTETVTFGDVDPRSSYTQTTTITATSGPGISSAFGKWNWFQEERKQRQSWKTGTASQIMASIIYLGMVEFIPAFIYYFGRNMAVMTNLGTGAIALICGLLRMVTFNVFLRDGGGHVDPGYSVGITILGKLNPFYWAFVFLYLTAQLLAACLAAGFTMGFTPGQVKTFGLGATGPTEPGFSAGAGIGLEIVLTAIYYYCLWKIVMSYYEINFVELANRRKEVASLAVNAGILHAAFTWISLKISGGNLNWFTNFWPRAISGTLDSNWWVALWGPVLGFIASLCMIGFDMWISDVAFHKIQINKPPLLKNKGE